ncbi:hypothetical protein PPYR_08479 [Photinus pyralis]|uniref:Sodium channel protein Nach n=1 Tax=Photinus pyralis TaxID=7054 RepID=A0A5N4AJL5_PHOPY|nr:hypothetical protein PPYR_08479 [Photinus pyralis]
MLRYWLNNTLELVPTPPALMVNPSISKPAAILMELTAGYKIFFHGYNELPDYYSTPINIPAATASKFQLTLSDLSTSPEVKDLQVSQRHCRLTSEGNLQYTPVYSHHLCFMECRMKVYLRVCNCTPYYFRRLGPDPICNPAGMNCLFKNLEEIEALGISSCHGCDTNCDEYVFTIDSVETTDWFLGTNVEWDLIKYPEIRYKRSLIFSGSNLIVQFGGATGLLLGASVLSLAEIVFFVTLRFCWCVFGKRQVD